MWARALFGFVFFFAPSVFAVDLTRHFFMPNMPPVPGTRALVQLGVIVLWHGWLLIEWCRMRRIHRRAYARALESGLRVCTKCEYPLPAEPLEGVCSECGCPYNPETLRRVWTERYIKLADVQPSTR